MSLFTGKDAQGRYWYKGVRWLGPTNEIGNRRGRSRGRWAASKRAPNPKDVQLLGTIRAANDGPFTLLAPSADSAGGLVQR